MSRYEVRIERKAATHIEGLPARLASRVFEAIAMLAENPRGPGTKKLVSRDGYRLRVGDYRALYLIDDVRREVAVYTVLHRKDVYR